MESAFEPISLDDINVPATAAPFDPVDVERSASALPDEWRASYAKLMYQSLKQLHAFLSIEKWTSIDDGAQRIQLFMRSSSTESQQHGYYTIKAAATLDVRPERLMYVIRDHDPATRSKWDKEYVAEARVIETMDTAKNGQLRVVTSEINMSMPLVANRVLLGIDWYGYDETSRIFKYVFRTTSHRQFRCAESKVNVIALVGVVVRCLASRHQCELTLIAYVNLGDKFPQLLVMSYHNWLRERIELYERVARNWNQYYKKTKTEKQT